MALYKGKFNYYGELFNFFRHATTNSKAYFLMTRKLALNLKISHYSVRCYFNGKKDNFKIKEVKINGRTFKL